MVDPLADVADLGVLADDLRRELYLYVSAQPDWVGRDEAAGALRISRHQAKFGLDRLEDAGLLQADYVRLSGRTGPGAGRPAKVYRRADREVSVSLPGREYELAGELMAEAITRSARDEVPVVQALGEVAGERGRVMGHEALEGGGAGSRSPLQIAADALARHGYEPRVEGAEVVLANCPFHALADTHTDLVCGMNHALLSGMCECLDGVDARLEPHGDRCCVVLHAVG